MFNRTHRHDPKAHIGLVLGKLVLGIAGAVIKKKIADRLASRKPAEGRAPHESHAREHESASHVRRVRRG